MTDLSLAVNVPDDRFFEVGLDRGMLYVHGKDGVPWRGLVSMNEKTKGGDTKPIYYDGIRVANRISREEYEATLEAYSSPEEFDECDGTLSIAQGLFARGQIRKKFDLSYRTLIGDAIHGKEAGYKIHVVYNLRATPSNPKYSTIADKEDTSPLSWDLSGVPDVGIARHTPTIAYYLDSRHTSPGALKAIEDILYGSEAAPPRLPRIEELTQMMPFVQA